MEIYIKYIYDIVAIILLVLVITYLYVAQNNYKIFPSLIFILLISYVIRNFNYWTKQGIPGPMPYIGFGTTFRRHKSYIEIDWLKRYGKLYGYFEISYY